MKFGTFPLVRVGLALYAGGFLWLILRGMYEARDGWIHDGPVYLPAAAMEVAGVCLVVLAIIRLGIRRLKKRT